MGDIRAQSGRARETTGTCDFRRGEQAWSGHVIGLLFVVATLHAAPLGAQEVFGLGGLGARLGAVAPEDAKTGFGWSVDADLGYLGSPRMRTVLGLNGFSADVDRSVGGSAVGGSLSAFGGNGGFRFETPAIGRFAPYLAATATVHNVTADVTDQGTKDLLEGVYAGAGLGAGFVFALDAPGRFMVTAETRRVFINNVGHWAFEAGMRYMPRGMESYERVPNRADEARREAEQRRAEVARMEEERRVADSLAAVRREVEQQRAAETEAEERRLREQREAEQRQAQQRTEQEMAALRARGDTLEAARRAEAERRATAEAEAEAARRRAAVADDARLAAERQAAEADRRRYAALVDLDRLMTDVTEIRETERGLSIVLGQGLFASAQYRLSPRARDAVGTIAAVLGQYPEHRVSVEGHTDAVGGELANQRLSEQRAESVRAALIAMGLDPARADAIGFGESRPVADNETAAGRAVNRRVEIVIVGARRPTP
ncbi:MAG TPA: OmpA family protein [Gemmatimonadaceae bacterium]|nr:OmpA family protein [Gemmatimonadaceae bacterium]